MTAREHNSTATELTTPFAHKSYDELLEHGAVKNTLARGDLYEAELSEMKPLNSAETPKGRVGLLGVMSMSNDHVRIELWGALDESGHADPGEIAVAAEGFDPQDLFNRQPGEGYLMLTPDETFGIGQHNQELAGIFGDTAPAEMSRRHGAILVTEDGKLKIEHQSDSYLSSTLLTAPSTKEASLAASTEIQPDPEALEVTRPRSIAAVAGGSAVQKVVEKPIEHNPVRQLELPEDSSEAVAKFYTELQQIQASDQGAYPLKELANRVLDAVAHTERADLGVLEALMTAGTMYTQENALAVTQILDRIQQDFKTLNPENMQWFRQIMGNLSFVEGAQEDIVRAYNNSVMDLINGRVFPEKEPLKVAFLAFATGLNLRDTELGPDYLQSLRDRIEP